MYEINYLSRPHLIYPSIENIFLLFRLFLPYSLLLICSITFHIDTFTECHLIIDTEIDIYFNKNFARKFYWLDSTFILSSYLPTNDSLYHDQTIKLCNRWTSLLSWNRKLSLVKCNEIRFLDIHHDFCTSWNINKIKRCFLIFCLNNPLVRKTR